MGALTVRGEGRFSDPDRRRYRVLYAGDRRACFLETLADFRPGLHGTATREFTRDWLVSRLVAEFTLIESGRRWRWLDLREPETHQAIRSELAWFLLDQGLTDFDISTATRNRLEVTQRVGGWAFERGYAGIVFLSRLDPNRVCWAIFERSEPEAVRIQPIAVHAVIETDPDLRAVMEIVALSLSTRP